MGVKGDKELIEALTKLASGEVADACTKELASRVLAKAVKRTPVGEYAKGSGKTGGTLRYGWVSDIAPTVRGNVYTLTVRNFVEYASYVEYGHRQTPGRYVPAIGKRLVKPWVDGQFMLTSSVAEVEKIKQHVINKRVQKYLDGVFK